jgi:hypothetical protein
VLAHIDRGRTLALAFAAIAPAVAETPRKGPSCTFILESMPGKSGSGCFSQRVPGLRAGRLPELHAFRLKCWFLPVPRPAQPTGWDPNS